MNDYEDDRRPIRVVRSQSPWAWICGLVIVLALLGFFGPNIKRAMDSQQQASAQNTGQQNQNQDLALLALAQSLAKGQNQNTVADQSQQQGDTNTTSAPATGNNITVDKAVLENLMKIQATDTAQKQAVQDTPVAQTPNASTSFGVAVNIGGQLTTVKLPTSSSYLSKVNKTDFVVPSMGTVEIYGTGTTGTQAPAIIRAAQTIPIVGFGARAVTKLMDWRKIFNVDQITGLIEWRFHWAELTNQLGDKENIEKYWTIPGVMDNGAPRKFSKVEDAQKYSQDNLAGVSITIEQQLRIKELKFNLCPIATMDISGNRVSVSSVNGKAWVKEQLQRVAEAVTMQDLANQPQAFKDALDSAAKELVREDHFNTVYALAEQNLTSADPDTLYTIIVTQIKNLDYQTVTVGKITVTKNWMGCYSGTDVRTGAPQITGVQKP